MGPIVVGLLGLVGLVLASATKLESGKRLILAGKFEEGIRALEEAAREKGEPEILLAIANAYDEWGDHCAEALAAFDRLFAACDRCAVLERAKNDVVLVANRCAADVAFVTEPAGAIVHIAGDDWERVTPFTTRLNPGRYAYEVHAEGRVARRDAFVVRPSVSQRIEAKLEVAAQALPLSVALDCERSAARDSGGAPLEGCAESRSLAAQATVPRDGSLGAGTWIAIGGSVLAGGAGAAFLAEGIHAVDRGGSNAQTSYALAYLGFGVCALGLALAAVLGAIEE